MAKHKNNLSRQTSHQSRQQLLFDNTATSPSNKTSEFSEDLCEMMVSDNIPLNKVNNEQFRTFLEKYTTQLIPDPSLCLLLTPCFFALPKTFLQNFGKFQPDFRR
jgi:hypothetical protein